MWRWIEVAITHHESHLKGIGIVAELYVGERKMEDILDIEVFFQAIESSGRYPLFTCDCGCFGCGGYYVDIECTEDAWIMRNKYHPHDEEELVEEFEYHFRWAHVYMVATQIKDYIIQVGETYPGTLLASGESGAFDMCAMLKAKQIINLHRMERAFNTAWFENYYALIERAAEQLGKVFHWYCEESWKGIWADKELELCDASGWLLDTEELADFEQCLDRHYYGKEGEDEEYYTKYMPRLHSIRWSMKRDGTIVIEFGPEEGE